MRKIKPAKKSLEEVCPPETYRALETHFQRVLKKMRASDAKPEVTEEFIPERYLKIGERERKSVTGNSAMIAGDLLHTHTLTREHVLAVLTFLAHVHPSIVGRELEKALENPNERYKLHIISVIGDMGHTRYKNLVLRQLFPGKKMQERNEIIINCLIALRKIGTRADIPSIMHLTEKHQKFNVRLQALTTIGKLGDDRDVFRLGDLVFDERSQLRDLAKREMERMNRRGKERKNKRKTRRK